MFTENKPFDTNVYFSGGAGMFIQYHDVIKPVYLYAIIQMILTKQSYGLPINIVNKLSIISLIEWYVNRRFKNPLKCLDYADNISINQLDKLMIDIISKDSSIYRLAPVLNIEKMFQVYRSQHMSFPVYVYSEVEEPYIKDDCKNIFRGIDFHYFFGDLKECIEKCDQNFTYIFSDIELVKSAAEILYGTCSHILLTRDYRYNYIDNHKTFRYDLKDIATNHPFIRIGTTLATNRIDLIKSYANLGYKEGLI